MVLLLSSAAPATAEDCPSFGLPERQEERFCTEFRDLLFAPYKPNTNRATAADRDKSNVDKWIKSNPLWGEVYRSDPKRTLDLISRIRKAGGEPQ